jgi:hypothetical protein
MGIVTELITNFIKELPLSINLREKLEQKLALIEKLEQENVQLKAQNAQLLERINAYNEEKKEYIKFKEEFVEHRGGLFKRRPGGGYHNTVFCIKCHMPISSFGGDFPYVCDNCNIPLDFNQRDLPNILKELPD